MRLGGTFSTVDKGDQHAHGQQGGTARLRNRIYIVTNRIQGRSLGEAIVQSDIRSAEGILHTGTRVAVEHAVKIVPVPAGGCVILRQFGDATVDRKIRAIREAGIEAASTNPAVI